MATSEPAAEAWPRKTESIETLSDAWALALQVDHSLAARALEAAAAEDEWHAKAGERWPTVKLESSYNLRSNEQAFLTSPASPLLQSRLPFRQRESVQSNVIGRLPLYTGGRIGADMAAAAQASEASRMAMETERLDLLVHAATAFLDVLSAERSVAVRKASVRTLSGHLENLRSAYERGMATLNELLTAEVRASTARQLLVQELHRRDLAWSTYNRLTGRPFEFRAVLMEAVPAQNLPPLEVLTDEALKRRLEVPAIMAEARMHDEHALSFSADRRPQLSLEGGYAFEENRFTSPQGVGYVGVRVDWNAVDGGQRSSRSRAARERALAAGRRAQELQSLVRLEVRRAWLALQEARSRIASTATNVSQAAENLRVAQKRFEQGMAKSVDVLDAEELYSHSNLRHFTAVYDAVEAGLQLDRAIGTITARSTPRPTNPATGQRQVPVAAP